MSSYEEFKKWVANVESALDKIGIKDMHKRYQIAASLLDGKDVVLVYPHGTRTIKFGSPVCVGKIKPCPERKGSTIDFLIFDDARSKV